MSSAANHRVVLALDTSTDMLVAAVACVSRAGEVSMLAQRDHLCRRRTNVELTTSLLECLEQAGLSMAEVDAVLVGRGPGSFTGVRIGIATAKGLTCGMSAPLYGASTLDAAAWAAWLAGTRGLLGVVGDAMRGEVYPGIYQLSDAGVTRGFIAETVLKANACVHEWAARQDADKLQLTGDGLKKYRAAFEEAGFSRFIDEQHWHPSAEGLLRAAAASQVFEKDAGDPALILPIYTRLSDAEESERQRLGLAQPASTESTGVFEGMADIHTQLRPMSVNDLVQVARLEATTYAGASHTPWTEAMFAEELAQPGRSWWVAHDQGSIVGFVGGLLAGDCLEVLDLAVAQNRRKEGIGSKLLERLAYDGQTLGASHITLEVDENNQLARSVYAKLGFEQEGRRRDYYGPGQHALILTASLPLTAELAQGEEHAKPRAATRPWPVAAAPRTPDQEATIAAVGPLVLAIESSCDETALAIIDGSGRILANVVATQIDFHARFGGVVPEIASRKHTEAIVGVYEEAMAQAGSALGVDTLSAADLAAVGVTAGPGLVGALVVGVAFAKGICAATGLPLIPVHHLEGHLLANLIEKPSLQPPFVASLVSGGNTMLVHVRAWGDYEILGQTIDDAVGEAFDKVAKALGLGYPGGPIISKMAAEGNPRAIAFPRAMLHSHDYRFSLSGLKTAVITYIQGENKAGRPINVPDLCASFQAAVVDVQVAKAATAVEECEVADFCVGGGVAANPALRAAYHERFAQMGVDVTVPPMWVCGDNGAMIAIAALRNLQAGVVAPLTLDAAPNARLGEWSSPHAPTVAGDL